MKIILGSSVFLIGLWGASSHLGQSNSSYWDEVAFLIVLCGTISVGIITLPVLNMRVILGEIMNSFRSVGRRRRSAIISAKNFLQGKDLLTKKNQIDQKILRDGGELIQLGFEREKIEQILTDRIFSYSNDCRSVSNWCRGLAKYPPAFGLIGTILGLISLMRGLSAGADPKETGLSMAIALVATLYGLLVANLVLNPVGERLRSNIAENELLCEISLRAILMAKDQVNLLEAQEVLNGYVGISGAVNNISLLDDEIKAVG